MEWNRTFDAKIPLVREMFQWLCAILERFSSSEVKKLGLACEEIFVNIVKHAYQDTPKPIQITICLSPQGRCEITFCDDGPLFDPVHFAPKLLLDSPVENRELGGLGLHFVRRFVDDMRYERRNEQNVLTLIKHLSRKHIHK